MLTKLVLRYLHFKEWWFLYRKGCLKKHDYEPIVVSSNGAWMFFEHCARCGYTKGLLEKWYEDGNE